MGNKNSSPESENVQESKDPTSAEPLNQTTPTNRNIDRAVTSVVESEPHLTTESPKRNSETPDNVVKADIIPRPKEADTTSAITDGAKKTQPHATASSARAEHIQRQSPTSSKRLLALKSTERLQIQPTAEIPQEIRDLPREHSPTTFAAQGNVPASFFHSPHNTQQWALKDVQARRYFSI